MIRIVLFTGILCTPSVPALEHIIPKTLFIINISSTIHLMYTRYCIQYALINVILTVHSVIIIIPVVIHKHRTYSPLCRHLLLYLLYLGFVHGYGMRYSNLCWHRPVSSKQECINIRRSLSGRSERHRLLGRVVFRSEVPPSQAMGHRHMPHPRVPARSHRPQRHATDSRKPVVSKKPRGKAKY